MRKFYVQPPASEINITLRNGPTVPKVKAKRSDVPPMYRNSIVATALKLSLMIAFILAVLNCILFFASVL